MDISKIGLRNEKFVLELNWLNLWNSFNRMYIEFYETKKVQFWCPFFFLFRLIIIF